MRADGGLADGAPPNSNARIVLASRSDQGLDTYLVVKVGSSGKNRAEEASNDYRRGASLGGFGGRRGYSDGKAQTVFGGDGGGSTGVFLALQQPTAPGQRITISRASHSVDFTRALLVAGGGAGSGGNEQRIADPKDPVIVANSYPVMAGNNNTAWTAVSDGPLPGLVISKASAQALGNPVRVSVNGTTFLEMPNGAPPGADLTAPVNTWTNPGQSVFLGASSLDNANGTTEFYIHNDAKTANDGGHGGNAPMSGPGTGTPMNVGWGAGGGGGGWVGGAAGMSYRSKSQGEIYVRSFGSSGAPGSSFVASAEIGQLGGTGSGVYIRRRSADPYNPAAVLKPHVGENNDTTQFAGIVGAEGFPQHGGYFKFWWHISDLDTSKFTSPDDVRVEVTYLDIV